MGFESGMFPGLPPAEVEDQSNKENPKKTAPPESDERDLDVRTTRITEDIVRQMREIEVRPEDRDSEGNLLVSPGGPVSELNEVEWRFVRTEAFEEWFSDSLITNQNGEPLVVYHGSPITFDEFDHRRSQKAKRDTGFFGSGNYFSPNRELAAKYGPNMYRCFLRVKKLQMFTVENGNVRFTERPLPTNIHDTVWSRYEKRRQQRLEEIGSSEADVDKNSPQGWGYVAPDTSQNFEDILSDAVAEVLVEQGYGGAIGYNPISKLDEYVVFDGEDVLIIPPEEK
ncbi:MAG: hypothetical protein ABIJ46_04255 [bacterium]